MNNNLYLTKASILKNKKLKNFNLSKYLSELKEFKEYPYLLIIYSKIENNVRFSIYPLKYEKLIKVSIWNSNISETLIEKLEILKNFDIIHTSGLLIKNNELFYECYLDLRFSDDKTKLLKGSLNNIKNMFKRIKIEEISLKK